MQLSLTPSTKPYRALVRFGDKAREEQYLADLRQLSPEGQMAIRDLNRIARNHIPRQHILLSQVLAGKYAEIRNFVQTELLAFVLLMKGRPEFSEKVREKQLDFRKAAATLSQDPAPAAPDYIPPEDIPVVEARRYLGEFSRFSQADLENRPGIEEAWGWKL